MRIIKVILLIITISLGLISCSNEGDIAPIILDNEYLEFDAQGGTQEITFTVNGEDWFVWAKPIGKADWCTYTPSNGSAGKHTLYLTVEPNRGSTRSVTIEINSHGHYKEVYVVQQGIY